MSILSQTPRWVGNIKPLSTHWVLPAPILCPGLLRQVPSPCMSQAVTLLADVPGTVDPSQHCHTSSSSAQGCIFPCP